MSFTTFCPIHGVSYGSKSCWQCAWDRGERTTQPEEQFAPTVRHGINWISVDDRLPPPGVTVLVWSAKGPSTAQLEAGFWYAVIEGEGVCTHIGDLATADGVTHWAKIKGPQKTEIDIQAVRLEEFSRSIAAQVERSLASSDDPAAAGLSDELKGPQT